MPATLTIEVSDYVYQAIQNRSQLEGKTPERVAADMLTRELPDPKADPLLRWAGCADSGLTDVSQRHDDYLGSNAQDDHKEPR